MAETLVVVSLEHITCVTCGIVFGVPFHYALELKRTHANFYCPSGHSQFFSGKSDLERLKDQIAEAKNDVRWWRDYSQELDGKVRNERRAHAATKGQLTKTKKRIANGVCPCCRRSFVQLQRHMKTQHPEYVADDAVAP